MTTVTGPQAKQIVIVKSQYQDRTVQLDLSDAVIFPATVVTAVPFAASPATAPTLVVTVNSVLNQTATITVSGGLDGVSYGLGLVITDSNAVTYQKTIAVAVKDNLAIKYQETNPYAFQTLLDTIGIGEAAIGKAFFMLPSGTNATNGFVTWSLLDKNGAVYATGNAYDYVLTATSTYTSIESHAVVNTPFDIEPSNLTDKYQLRWELTIDGVVQSYAFENIVIDSAFSTPTGAQDTVEMFGDTALLSIVLEKPWDNVSLQIFSSLDSTPVGPAVTITETHRVSSGWYYEAQMSTANVPATLDPYIVSWKFSNARGPAYRDTGQLFVVNPSIMRSVKGVEAMVSKAKTTLLGFRDELFSVSTIMTMLARGRDSFNAAAGMFTQFTMTGADSFIREYWMRYAEVALLEAQYLLEGEKAYNFAGQAISLDVDRTQYYQSLADSIKSRLSEEIKPIKQNLLKKGLISGDGSMTNLNIGSTGPLGLSVSPVSNIRSANLFFNQRYY